MDFGLAKLTVGAGLAPPRVPQDTPTASIDPEHLTRPGTALGTVAYMSPEQARGEEVDARTDLFSFGAVLYEMGTGQMAFSGNTTAVIFDAILHGTPTSPLQLNPGLPAQLEHIVNKLLEKDREMRYQSASELRTDLKRAKRDTESGRRTQAATAGVQGARPSSASVAAAPAGIQPASAAPHKKYWVVAAGVALLFGAIMAYRYGPRPKAPSGPSRVTQISHWNKPMDSATLSPDGHTVAFSSPVSGVEQVFVMLPSGGGPLQLTHDEGDKYVDSFSPDGTEIYYGRALGRDEEWAVPALGGTPRQVVSGRYLMPSPDGSSVFYLKSDSRAVFRAGKSGLGEDTVNSFDNPAVTPISVLPFPDSNDLLVESFAVGSSWNQVHYHKVNLSTHTDIDLGR